MACHCGEQALRSSGSSSKSQFRGSPTKKLDTRQSFPELEIWKLGLITVWGSLVSLELYYFLLNFHSFEPVLNVPKKIRHHLGSLWLGLPQWRQLGQELHQFIMEFLLRVIKNTWLLPPERTEAKNTCREKESITVSRGSLKSLTAKHQGSQKWKGLN